MLTKNARAAMGRADIVRQHAKQTKAANPCQNADSAQRIATARKASTVTREKTLLLWVVVASVYLHVKTLMGKTPANAVAAEKLSIMPEPLTAFHTSTAASKAMDSFSRTKNVARTSHGRFATKTPPADKHAVKCIPNALLPRRFRMKNGETLWASSRA